MHSTLQDSSSIPPIPKLQDNDTLGGMQDLTSAIQEMDNILWRMQTRLLRVDGLDDLAGRWRNVDERFRNIVTTSKLAASSMTVLLAEYQSVILPCLRSGNVPLSVLRAEVALLEQNVKSRMTDLTSRDQLAMDTLCTEISNLMNDTKDKVTARSTQLERDAELIMGDLSRLKGQLKEWTSRRNKEVLAALTSLATGAVTCFGAAVSGGLDPESLWEAVVSALATGRSIMKSVQCHMRRRDIKHGLEAAQRVADNQVYHNDALSAVQPDLVASDDMNPSFALKADIIVHLHALLLNELQKLDTELANREQLDQHSASAIINIENERPCTLNTLIPMLDLYSKQALFSDRASVPAPRSPLVMPTKGRRKRIYNKIRGFTAFHDLLNAESPRTCRV